VRNLRFYSAPTWFLSALIPAENVTRISISDT